MVDPDNGTARLIQFTDTIEVKPRFGVISFMGYLKLSISTFKYLPQFYWNYKRKSTKGWSIFNIIMDLTGGLFSFGQMGLQVIFGEDVEINIVKTVLGVMVVVYDFVFIIQHYCIYPEGREVPIHEEGKYRTLVEDKRSLLDSEGSKEQLPEEPIGSKPVPVSTQG